MFFMRNEMRNEMGQPERLWSSKSAFRRLIAARRFRCARVAVGNRFTIWRNLL
jgi:hypothetical protein